MSTFFFDTSALAKRYLSEAGSTWARAILNPAAGHVILLTAVTTVEMFSLLARRAREGTIPAANAMVLGNGFLVHVENEYMLLPVDNRVLTEARIAVRRYPVRTLDAIPLASAQIARAILGEPISFVSSDQSLLASAAAEGFRTDDPLLHL